MHLRVHYLPSEKVAVFDLDLPQLGANQSYQAWQITGSGPVSLGVVAYRGTTAVQADLSGASALALSVEPAGGSRAPTTTPILVSDF